MIIPHPTHNLGPQSKSDSKDIAALRLHQSTYRAEVLKEPFGYGPTKSSKNQSGNILINGEVTGSNFITTEAFRFAKEKVMQKALNKNMLIDEYRLFNNMLSSMPMCFNLFADLKLLVLNQPEKANSLLEQLFSELSWAKELACVDVEFIPVDIENYTNDKSAFDAMLIVKDASGKKGLISIETKYSDILGDNAAADSQTKNELVKQNEIFNEVYAEKLAHEGYKQIHRNYLLTYAYAKRNNFKHFANVVISPKFDKLSVDEINEVNEHLNIKGNTLFKIPLEDFVSRGIQQTTSVELAEVMNKFHQRYLGY